MTLGELINQATKLRDDGTPLDTKIVRSDNSTNNGYETVYDVWIVDVQELNSKELWRKVIAVGG